MINIQRKEDCCGCGACFDVCSIPAIVWKEDYEGFSYPRVDLAKCVNCGLCNKVCPIENSETINSRNKTFSPIVFGAYHKDEAVRFSSTSGGAFWGLAESFVKEGGYVAGAVFYDHFKIKHIVTNSIEELQKIKGSKYAQSDCRGMFKRIASLLQEGERVMATGLPCQMAALRQYLRKDYENLLVVDLICHSVPSPLLFERYIAYLEKKYKSEVIKYHPKNKELGGWHKFSFKAHFKDGQIYHQNSDLYTLVAFANGYVMSRQSCYECHFKHFPQPSDITIGDFWGVETIDPKFDSPQGVSKIVINNSKGNEYIKSISSLIKKKYDTQVAVFDNNRGWSEIQRIPCCDKKERNLFVQNLHKYGFEYSVWSHIVPCKTIKQRIAKAWKLFLVKI